MRAKGGGSLLVDGDRRDASHRPLARGPVIDLLPYGALLAEIKDRIATAQTRAVLAVNGELNRLYWQIGRSLDRRQAEEGWGAAVIPRLARDLRNELPELKGFSERNIKLMLQFFRTYPSLFDDEAALVQPAVAQMEAENAAPARSVQPLVARLPWAHNVLLMQSTREDVTRRWYAEQALSQGWSRNVLKLQIESMAHARQGRATNNFDARLPAPQSDLARQAGQGFAFVGRQYPLTVGDNDFYIDLLFYHLKLRAYLVVELKRGDFKPEYAGKLNFYCNVVDETMRHPDDAPTIGLILCQDKDNVLAEYALRGIDKPIGIASYALTRALPATLQSALPSIERIEAEFGGASPDPNPADP